MMPFAKMFVIYFIIYCAECIIELSLNAILTQIENSLCFSDRSFFKAEVLFWEQLFSFEKSFNNCN